MNGIIVAGHGKFASGLLSASELISGKSPNIISVNFLQGMSVEALDWKLEKAIENLNHVKNIVFLCDIAGGTPYNRAVILAASKSNLRVISGANLYSVVTSTFELGNEIDTLVESIISSSKNGIYEFEIKKRKYEILEDEDFI